MPESSDPLKHFDRNCAFVKLLALLIMQLRYTALLALLGFGLGRAAGWW